MKARRIRRDSPNVHSQRHSPCRTSVGSSLMQWPSQVWILIAPIFCKKQLLFGTFLHRMHSNMQRWLGLPAQSMLHTDHFTQKHAINSLSPMKSNEVKWSLWNLERSDMWKSVKICERLTRARGMFGRITDLCCLTIIPRGETVPANPHRSENYESDPTKGKRVTKSSPHYMNINICIFLYKYILYIYYICRDETYNHARVG